MNTWFLNDFEYPNSLLILKSNKQKDHTLFLAYLNSFIWVIRLEVKDVNSKS